MSENRRNEELVQRIEIDGLLIDLPEGAMLSTLSRQIEQARIEAGLTMDEMFAGLRTQRAIYVKEKYGITD
ncbi:MAG: hypothetical protein KBG20_17825 [Caldilineaceae bacterium]|nr:hypothetical protein [Caldilineaceae bacterium]MBP8109617.1 hypothetical protein [Caldilineaceae bacterium]MBP8124493.1 hypothetical protein [Caldilineaceae bacterium]MBP9074170.1 hypothetical protein [Caldilineaceae bacterium]